MWNQGAVSDCLPIRRKTENCYRDEFVHILTLCLIVTFIVKASRRNLQVSNFCDWPSLYTDFVTKTLRMVNPFRVNAKLTRYTTKLCRLPTLLFQVKMLQVISSFELFLAPKGLIQLNKTMLFKNNVRIIFFSTPQERYSNRTTKQQWW